MNIFKSEIHKERFIKALQKSGHALDNSEYCSCLYLLTSDMMYSHIKDCFGFNTM